MRRAPYCDDCLDLLIWEEGRLCCPSCEEHRLREQAESELADLDADLGENPETKGGAMEAL